MTCKICNNEQRNATERIGAIQPVSIFKNSEKRS